MADPFDYGVNFLSQSLGLTPEQARGAVKWMSRVESGLNPGIVNPTSGAFGIGQWLGPRKAGLFQQYGRAPGVEQQFSYVADELRGPEAKALQALRGAKTEDEAFRAWGKYYERPSPAEYEAATGGYKSGMRTPRPGYYQGPGEDKPYLHVTLRAREPEGIPLAILDQILGQHKEAEGEKQKSPIALLDELLAQKPEAKPAAQAAPPDDLIEPPGLVPPAANVIDQGALEPADIKPIGTATDGPKAEIAVDRPKEPAALLDSLLSEAIEPMPKGAALPPLPAAGAAHAPESLLDSILRQAGTAVHAAAGAPAGIAQGAADIGQAVAGLGERAALGAQNLFDPERLAGARKPIERATIPVEPGLRAAGGLADFATGGYVGHLAPPAASVTQNVSRETSAAMPSLMASEQGAVPLRARGAPPRVEPTSGGGRGRFPLLDPPVPGEGLKQTATRVDDALHRVMTNGTADKIEVKRWWQSLPRIYKDAKTRAMMADDIERRMIDPKAELSPVSQAFIDGPGKGLIANENRIVNWLRRELGPDAKYADLPSASEGYVHRVVEAPPGRHREEVIGRLDPEKARVSDVVTGSMSGRGRSLSKFASSMQRRAPRFVLQDEAGNRVFQKHETLSEKGYEYGQEITTPDGQRWTVKQPTMAEMEANTPVRYIHDYIGNLVSNVLRLRRIKRNVELLRDLKSEFWEKGLFFPEGTQEIVPEHFKPVDLPQLKGYADPKIANVLNDFWNPGDDLSKTLSNVNRFLIGTLFVTPVPHINNVAAHWMIGRGWDWMSVPAYIRGAKAGAKAINAVWNLTPEYTRMLREGSGLLYGDVAMENFYNQLIQKTWTEQLRNPDVWTAYAKSLGLKGLADLIRAEYRWSRKTLWAANDMLMLQRQFELEMRGKPTREAIFQAERDIPNYRVPSEVMGSRPLSLALKSPNLMNFGRYHYGLMRSLSEMVKDMIGPKATLAERTEAAGKLTVLGMIGILGYPALDALLQQVTGNEDATAKRAGPLSVLSAGGYLARNAYQKFSGESASLRNPFGQQLLPGDKEWVSITAPLMTPAPVISMIPEVTWGRDWMGREIVDPRASPMGMAVQTGEAVASHISPLQMLMQSAQEGGGAQAAGNLVGLSLPRKTPGPSGKTEKMLRGRARSRERRDPVQNLIESVVGP